MPRKDAATMEMREIDGIGMFSDGPKLSGRRRWERWPFRSAKLYNTVAGCIYGYRMFSRIPDSSIDRTWVGIEEGSVISGVPESVLKGRWWAAAEGVSYAWPWTTIRCKDDKPQTRLHSLLFWSQWVWVTHVSTFFGVTAGVVNNWVEEGPIETSENPFRVRAGTGFEVLYFPDVVEMGMRGKLWKLMRGRASLDDVEPLIHLTPRAIADLKLGGRWSGAAVGVDVHQD